MSLRNSAIEAFTKIVGKSNVLTDPEDLYVYSFEHFFKKRQYPQLDAVIRATDAGSINAITEQARKDGVQLLRRGAENSRTIKPASAVTILIDDAPMPQLETLKDPKEKALLRLELEKEIQAGGHGTYRNYALALQSFLSGLPAQKCLSCNVCSGYCTVASSFNGVETWSSKGRALLTQALFSGELQPSPKIIDVLYNCSLCGLCFGQCFESTQVRKAIMDARHRLVESQQAPELFAATAKNISEVGDPSGMPPSKRVTWTQQLSHKRSFSSKADILYWAGCVASTRTPNAVKALANVLSGAQTDFTFLGEKEGCCGYVLLAAGLWDKAKENAVGLIERVKATGAATIVTPCAGCYYTFTKMYPEILQVELPCQVLHSTQYVEGLLKKKSLDLNSLSWKVTYHDPCSLGRHCGVYDSPRNVLNAVPDIEFLEMPLNKSRARCCGAGGGLWSFNNAVAMNAAVDRLVKDLSTLQVRALVTACPTCHMNLRFASVKKRLGIKVYDVMEIIELATAVQQGLPSASS